METAPVPPPKRGGTFFYCLWSERRREHGGVTHVSCGWPAHGHITPRFRTLAAYRRHYRRAHA